MTPTTTTTRTPSRQRRRQLLAGIALLGATATFAACGGSTNTPAAPQPAATDNPAAQAPADGSVLPATSNPITNTSTNQALTIDSVLVENNVDPATGKSANDHLEIAVTNTGTTTLDGFDIYYTIDDPTTGDTESYYTALPTNFTIAAGASRIIHFDDTAVTDHFPDNPYSLYHTSLNALDVTIEVSATNAAPQTMTVAKDPGGDEVAD